MATKVKSLSALIDSQLPNFIVSEYPKFSAFMQKYYEQLELPGQPVDLILNLTKYRDIDTYTHDLLNQQTILTQNISQISSTINVEDTSSFPDINGYILIDNEVIFYKTKTETSFVNCYRNISSTTKLGDLYNQLEFKNTSDDSGTGVQHLNGSAIFNISHLFLYSLVKNFEYEYLSSFPEASLKSSADKSLLIKNIKKFYASKGTESSIKFLFNALVPSDVPNDPTVYYPKDSTYKPSYGEWINNYSLKAKIVGNISDIRYLIGAKIIQQQDQNDSSVGYASAVIDNIISIGEGYYEIILVEQSIVGEFSVISETYLTSSLLSNAGTNKRINVYSTNGWRTTAGTIIVGSEEINYKSKTVNQFIIGNRGSIPGTYTANTPVYKKSNVSISFVGENNQPQTRTILVLGILYNLSQNIPTPYSVVGDAVEIASSGFDSKNPIIFNKTTNSVRWNLNENNTFSSISSLSEVPVNVSAIYEDDQYYYIASSGYPNHAIGKNSWNITLEDQKNLKLIRKFPTRTTEIYETTNKDVGVLINGVPIRGVKDDEVIIFGEITKFDLVKKGSGYLDPPKVLVIDTSGVSGVATGQAVLSGDTVDRIDVVKGGSGFFPPVPTIIITSGRNATAEPVITNGRITSIKVTNPGEYYTTPPKVVITDSSGKGRFASFTSVISEEGQLVGFLKNEEGKSYDSTTTTVTIQAIGSGAEAVSIVRTWTRNRFEKLKQNLDDTNGHYFLNNNPSLGYGYNYIANPKALRVSLADNLDNIGNVPSVLTHSPIIGFAYDGNPIYGPYGYQNFGDSSSSIVRMTSSYKLKTTRSAGPSITAYPLGSFVEDYEYLHRSGILDENNGRFCVTPDYPEGTYAYFTTILENNTPVYPYFLGKNYYSIPVDSNYNKTISQDDIPRNVTRLRTNRTKNNGDGVVAFVESVKSGSISSVDVVSSIPSFSVDGIIDIDYSGTNGSDILAKISSVKGKSVNSLLSSSGIYKFFDYFNSTLNSELISAGITSFSLNVNSLGFSTIIDAKNIPDYNLNTTDVLLRNNSILILLPPSLDKCVKLTTESPCYLFDGDIITQSGSSATGRVVGNVFNSKTIVLKEVNKRFENINSLGTNTLFSSIEVLNLVVDKVSSFSLGSEIFQTTGKQAIILSVTNGVITLASNTFINNEPVIFSSAFSELETNKIYYVVDSQATSFKIASSPNGSPILLSDTSNPGSVVLNQKAVGIVLESTEEKNTCKVKVLRGTFDVSSEYFLKTNNLRDTVGSKIVQKNPLSSNIKVLTNTDKIAILKTNENHNISVGDLINVDIKPDDTTTTITIYVRKTIYQKLKLNTPVYTKTLNDSGIGRVIVLNSGSDYASDSFGNATYTNVELIFSDQAKCRGETGQVVTDLTNAVIGNPGNTNNARATIRVTNGLVTSVQITYKGKFYKKSDILTTNPNSIYRNPISVTSRFLTIEVDHAGFAAGNNVMFLNEVSSISNNDLLQIGTEIVKVVSINTFTNSVVVQRAQENTSSLDHIDKSTIFSYLPKYLLNFNYQLGNTPSDPYVSSYNPETKELVVFFNSGNTLTTINSLSASSFFYDQNTPKKLVGILDIIESPKYKFEFSYDNINWTKNPITPIQNYYKYKFDTSNPSMAGSFLEFSPSGNYNILTTEIEKSNSLPGFANSFITLKIGFGANIASNNFSNKKDIEFTNYYYFDKNSNVDSEKAYLKIIDDPLQGEHQIIYNTPTEIVYELEAYPQHSGSGIISYTTTSSNAVGEINTVKIVNSGKNMSKLPLINGVQPSSVNECLVDVTWNENTGSIIGINILNPGSNYSNPKAILSKGDGKNYAFDVRKNADNTISAVILLNGGSGFTFQPEIKIIETDVKLYFSSSEIGIPTKISLIDNGKGFNSDTTTKRKITSDRILVLKDFPEKAFFENEIVEQYDGTIKIASGYVSKEGWREGSNVLRLNRVEGEFKNNLQITGKTQNKTAFVVRTFVGEFNYDIKSYFDNIGYYASDRSKIGASSQKLTDSYFYQDYSYVVKSRTPIDIWRRLVKSSTHPAGFKLFGEVAIDSFGDVKINQQQPKSDHISTIQLWDPEKNKITIEKSYRTLTQIQLSSAFVDVQRGKGSLFVNTFDDSETQSFEIYLTPEFNGYFDANGNRSGNKTFTIRILGSNNILSVPKQENLVISLDGIIQQPGDAFTVSGTQITFNEAPLGYRNLNNKSITSSQYVEGSDTPKQKFLGKVLRYKDTTTNHLYFKKIKDISSQFNGVQTSFNLLNSVDNSNIILESNDNLIVTIDGVLQNSGITPVFPVDRSYYIKRNAVPNQIVFTEPPSLGQTFGAHSISNYEIAEIDETFVTGSFYGPFIMRRKINKKPLEVFNDNNVLVFIDRVLQKKTRNYNIQGSSITFTNPILPGQKIYILYFYGRSATTSVTAFNYEEDTYFNLVKIDLNYLPPLAQYADRICYQGDNIQNYTAIGKAKGAFVTSTGSTLIIEAQNALFVNNKNITIINGLSSGLGDLIIPYSSISNISAFETDEDTNGILQKTTSGWLIGSSLGKKIPNFVDIGDQIKIDGETNYRTIISLPEKVFKSQYNINSPIANNFYGKLTITPNQEIFKGEGLTVFAEVKNGKLSALKWNDRKYGQYEFGKVQPGAYGYENAPKLVFVPQALRDEGGSIIAPAQGGGAEGFVVVSGGEVIDVVLTSAGSGYLTSPKVYVTKGYDIIKNPEKRVSSKFEITFFPTISTTLLISSIVNLEYGFSVHEAESIISPTELLETSTIITALKFVATEIIIPSVAPYDSVFTFQINLTAVLNSVVSFTNDIVVNLHTLWNDAKETTIKNINQEITKTIPTGFVDFLAEPVNASISYSSLTLGPTLNKFQNGAFNDMGFVNMGGITLDQFERTYGDIQIQDFELRSYSAKATIEETLMNLGYGSTNEYGAYLQTSLTTTSSIIYISNTDRFPSAGKLLVGDEIVTYTSKLSDRFIGVLRGEYNTIAKTHNAGDYLRTLN
jgi:hypothetical protein